MDFLSIILILLLLAFLLYLTSKKSDNVSYDNRANMFIRDLNTIIGGPEYVVVPSKDSYIENNTIYVKSKDARGVYLEIINLLSNRIHAETFRDVVSTRKRLLMIAHDLKYLSSEDLKGL